MKLAKNYRRTALWIISVRNFSSTNIGYVQFVRLRVRTHQQSRVESSPFQSSQTLESLELHTGRVESNQVCASSSGFLVLFEQRASKEVYSDGEHACFERDYVEKEVAS